MSEKVELSDRESEPKDRFSAQYETFSEWLDAEAPEEPRDYRDLDRQPRTSER